MTVLKKLNILYCHGLGSSRNNRHGTQLELFFEKFKNVYFERFLYKNPGSTDHVWHIKEWRSDIEERIAGQKWVLIGTSGACHAVLTIAKQKPENVQGLFLLCPGTGLGIDFVDTIAPGAMDLLKKRGSLVYPPSRNGHPALVTLAGLQEYADTCVTKTPGPIEINCPVTIVHGTEDPLVPYQNSVNLRKRLTSKNADFLTLDGATHYFDIDAAIQKKLEQFIEVVQKKNDDSSKL